jgi:hypothetical protein
MLTVSTCRWQSQKKVYHWKKVRQLGKIFPVKFFPSNGFQASFPVVAVDLMLQNDPFCCYLGAVDVLLVQKPLEMLDQGYDFFVSKS